MTLSVSLDQHRPRKNNINNVKTKIESFLCDIQKHTKNHDQGLQGKLKTKIRCEKNMGKKFETKSTLQIPKDN